MNQSAADRLFKDTGISQHGLPESETFATFSHADGHFHPLSFEIQCL